MKRMALVLALSTLLTPLVAACAPATPVVVEKEVVKEVQVEKPVVVEKEVIKEVPVEKVVEKEVVKEVPVEKVVEKEVVKEVEVMITPTAEPLDPISQLDPSGQEVTFWHVSTQIHEEILLELIDEFNATNLWGITVKPEYGGYYGDIRTKILAAIAADEPPDMAVSYQNMVAEYATAEVVEPLDDYISSTKYGLSREELADYFEAFIEGDRYPAFGGQILSFPPNRSMEVMYYNTDWLIKLGYEEPPKTWGEFYEMCQGASDEAAGTFGYAISPSASTFAGWVWTRGGEILSADGKSAVFEKEGVEALTFLRKLVDEGLAYQIAERYGDQTDFANEKVLFTFGSTAGLPYYALAVQDEATGVPRFNWSIAPLPHDTVEPIVDMYGPSICVFKTTPERQLAAWLFLKWFTAPDQTAQWAMTTGYFPVRKSAAQSEEMLLHFSENPLYAKAFSFLPYAKTEPTIAGWQPVRDALEEAIVGVISGERTPEQAIEEAARTAEEVIAE